MKKQILFLCFVLAIFGVSAQNNEAMREHISNLHLVKVPHPGQILFSMPVGDNDTLFFCVTDTTKKTVAVCSPNENVDWHVGLNYITGDVVIPETVEYEGTKYTVTTIGQEAFYFLFELTSVTIPNTVTAIGEFAFACCENLKSITIPSAVTAIGDWAFYGCTSLKSFEVPASVTFISGNILTGCMALQKITVDENNTVYDSRNNCNAIMHTATSTLVAGCATTVIPSDTKILGDEAFMFQYPLEEIGLPTGLLVMGDNSFCFTGLKKIKIPNTVTTLKDNALHGCEFLTGSIVIPASVTEIGVSAFTSASQITSLSVDPANTVYDSRENCNCVIHTATNELIGVCYYSVIPESVKILGKYLISNMTMPEYFNIPNSVTTMKTGALAYCNGTKTVIIPDSVTEIADEMFHYSDYENIGLPAGITKIGKDAFSWCDNLTTISSRAEVAPTLGKDAFDYGELNPMTIYIPCGSRESYDTTWVDSAFTFVEVDGMVFVQSEDTLKGTASVDTIMACPENTAIISATPNRNYIFSHWSDKDTTNPRTIELNGNQVLIAYFKSDVAVNDYATASFSAYGANGIITVDCAESGDVRIYDITGRLIMSERLTGRKSFNMPQTGVYLVTVDNSPAKKVMVY